jgi:hypothetical protein
MCKWQRVIPRRKGSPRYRIAHGWKDEFGSFNLEALKFLMHFREPGSSLYFISISYILIYFFFSHVFLYTLTFFFFLSFFLSFFYFFLVLICSPWTLSCIVPTSSPLLRHLLVLEQRGDRDNVGTRNIFSFGEILEIFNLGTILRSSLNWRSTLNDRLWSRR